MITLLQTKMRFAHIGESIAIAFETGLLILGSIIALPIAIPFGIALELGRRQVAYEGRLKFKQFVEDKTRLWPPVSGTLSRKLQILKDHPVVEEDKQYADELRDDIEKIVNGILSFEKEDIETLTSRDQCKRGIRYTREYSERYSDHFKDIHAAIQRRIAFNTAHMHDVAFIDLFEILYDIVTRYRVTHGSIEFLKFVNVDEFTL